MAPSKRPARRYTFPNSPFLFPSHPVLAPEAGTLAVQQPAPGLLPRGGLLRNAVPAPDRGSVAAPPTAPEKLRSLHPGPSSSSGISGASTNGNACLGLFSHKTETRATCAARRHLLSARLTVPQPVY